MEIVFETDFGTNYNTTRNAWVNNYTDIIGTMDAAAFGADFITAAKIADSAFLAVNFAASSLDGKGDWNIGKTGYSLSTAPLTAAQVNAEVDTALADINLDHFVGTSSGIPSLPAGTYLDLLQDDGTATYSRTTDSLQAIRDHATTIKSDTANTLTDTAEIGTAGAGLSNINLPNQTMDITGDLSGSVGSVAGNVDGSVGSNVELGPAEVNAECDTAISDAALATAANLAIVDTNVDDLELGIIFGTAATGTLSTTQATSNLTGFTDDQLIGRIIVFTAGPADGEATDITDYASSNGLLTFTALTLAPENGNAFKVI